MYDTSLTPGAYESIADSLDADSYDEYLTLDERMAMRDDANAYRIKALIMEEFGMEIIGMPIIY